MAAVNNGDVVSVTPNVADIANPEVNPPQLSRDEQPTLAPKSQEPDFTSVDYSIGPNGERLTERMGPCSLYDGYTNPEKMKLKFTSHETGYDKGGEWVRHGLILIFWDEAMTKKYGEEAWFAGNRHGPIKSWDEYEQQVTEGTYWQGIKHGTFRSWHHNGKPKGVNTWNQGKYHGVFIDYDESGERLTEGIYEDDQLVRVPFERKIEFETLGPFKVKIVTQGYRTDAKTFTPHGKATKWRKVAYQTEKDDPFRLWAVAEFMDGKQQGKSISYQEEFVLRNKNRVKTGKLIKAADSEFMDGVQDGPHMSWDDYGNKLEEGSYQKGLKVGKWTYNSPNGKSRIVEESKVGTTIAQPDPKTALKPTPDRLQPLVEVDDAILLKGEWVCTHEEFAGKAISAAELQKMNKTLTVSRPC